MLLETYIELSRVGRLSYELTNKVRDVWAENRLLPEKGFNSELMIWEAS